MVEIEDLRVKTVQYKLVTVNRCAYFTERMNTMSTIKVLLCCGGGFSSGMLAQKARKEAKKREIDITFDAKSESQASDYLSKVDALLLGPHYEKDLEKFKNLAKPFDVPVSVIPKSIYGMVDGAGLVDYTIDLIKNKE